MDHCSRKRSNNSMMRKMPIDERKKSPDAIPLCRVAADHQMEVGRVTNWLHKAGQACEVSNPFF